VRLYQVKENVFAAQQARHTGVTPALLALEVIDNKSLWQPDL